MYPVQKIYLTATLPPRLEHELRVASSLPNSVPVIRESTDRPNLAYHVLHYNGHHFNTLGAVVKLAELLGKEFESDSRGIVFCREIERVDLLATRFHGCKDHSKMAADDRMAQFERWRSGMAKWIVATTGLMHGIDYGWVDAIIFLEMPYGLVNFAQGAGRAGRRGRPANIFLLHSSEQGQIMPRGSSPDETCLLGGDEYMLNMTECRRSVMTRIMDGEGIRCKDRFNTLPCDICDPESELVVASKALMAEAEGRARRTGPDAALWRNVGLGVMRSKEAHCDGIRHQEGPDGLRRGYPEATQQQTPALRAKLGVGPSMSILMDVQYAERQGETLAAKVKTLSRSTEVMKGHCVVCWAWKKKLRATDHKPFLGCRDQGEFVKYAYGWLDFKKELRKNLGTYKYCYNCGLPQGKLLPSSHPSFEQGSGAPACPLNDFAALMLWHVFHHAETWNAAKQGIPELGEIGGIEEFKSWLVRTTGQDRFWNGLELILWFMEQREGGLM